MNQLRMFLVLAKELHFSRAAQRVFMTQPGFSQQISRLEERLETRLVERGPHSVVLTPAGKALLPAITSVVEAMDSLRLLADEHGRKVRGHLVLGVVGGEGSLPHTRAMLAELRRRHPGIIVEFRSLDLGSQFHDVARGGVDAALLVQPVPPDLQTLDLATGPRVLVLPAGDPLAADDMSPLTLAQFKDRTFVDVPPEASREWWDTWSLNPRPDGSSVRYGPVVHDIEGLMLAVARGHGIVFLPSAARDLYPRPGIAYVDVADLPPYTSALAWAPKNRSHPLVAALREAARASIDT